MVNTNELRRLNKVLYSEGGSIFEVGQIFDDNISNNDQCQWIPISCFDPIPLTEEWLLRMGFEKDRHGFALKNKMSLSIHVSKELGFMPCWADLVLTIKYNLLYVHQLQNLYFALTGEELEIKDLDPQNVQ